MAMKTVFALINYGKSAKKAQKTLKKAPGTDDWPKNKTGGYAGLTKTNRKSIKKNMGITVSSKNPTVKQATGKILPFYKEKSEKEHLFTSTGIKFWRHKDQMESYVNKTGKTIISTHISPEGACNLKCSYL
jgi:hypothetical protein